MTMLTSSMAEAGDRRSREGTMAGFHGSRVGVLLGGSTRERDVSLDTGRACAAALRSASYEVVELDWRPGRPMDLLAAGVDVVLLALHGGYGEGGSVQGFLNCAGIPYTGSGVLASALAMDKVRSKRVFEASGLRTPAYVVLSAAAVRATGEGGAESPPFGFPCVVKPAREGSSVGISIVDDADGYEAALAAALRGGDDVLVEAFIAGRELSAGVFDDEVLGIVEIVPGAGGFYDYTAKYRSQTTEYRLPAPISAEAARVVARLAKQAYDALGCRGVARVDLMLEAEADAFLLEVNTLPGMTATSLVPKMARARGESFEALVSRMLETAQIDEA